MPHTAYHEVEAGTPRELGRKLGLLFGEDMHASVAEARGERGWKARAGPARQLLRATETHFPRLVEELEAYAEAADVALLDLWMVMLEDELGALAPEKCTTVVTNGGRLIAHNEDWDPEAADAICVLKKRIGDVTVLELHYAATPLGGSALSISSHGWVQAINSLDHNDRQVGVPRNVVARWLSQTRDLEGDVARLKSIPRSSGYNHVLVSAEGALYDLECTATRAALSQPATPFAHTNHYLSRELVAFEDGGEDRSTRKRYERACALARDPMSVAQVMALGSDATQGATNSILNRNTIARAVVDFDARAASIWLAREKQKGWVTYPLDFLPAAAWA
ncbi:MAG TPA: C45 family peptidase [Hyphomicrobiaceae bacterium]|nr:C45 family peptidase [Hyphomicrobiaceae bacterium]